MSAAPTWSQEPIPPNPFNCELVQNLPFGGAEILFLSCFFLFMAVVFCVSFMDIALKQAWPAKFLDAAVAKRVAEIQKGFPLLGKKKNFTRGEEESEEDEEEKAKNEALAESLGTPFYDACASQGPYVAGRSVDEDLIPILCNNWAYPTVSSYCSSTVRGYAMLSTLLLTAGICLGYLWSHNVMVYPGNGGDTGKISLLGYILIFLTGCVMCGPNQGAVYRNANIALFSNLPLHIGTGKKRKDDPWLKLHEIGVGSFIVLPLLAHGYDVIKLGKTMPNYTGTATGVYVQVACALFFGVGMLMYKCKQITKVQSMQWEIIAEIAGVFASFIAYFQHEFYASAVCSGYYTHMNALIYIAAFAPFAIWIKRHYTNAPTEFPTEVSLLLLNKGNPVAATSTTPAAQFSQAVLELPIVHPIKPQQQETTVEESI